MQATEIIRGYIQNEIEEEDKQREINRKKVKKAVEQETKNVLAEIAKDKRYIESRRAILKTLWEQTFKLYGPDILTRIKSPETAEAVRQLEEDLRENLQNIIIDIMTFELDMINNLKEMQEDEEQEENYENQRNESQYEEQNVEEEQEEDSQIREEVDETEERYKQSEQEIPPEEYNRNIDQRQSSGAKNQPNSGRKDQIRKSSPDQPAFANTSPQRPNYFYPKYITKREKMERMMKVPGYVEVNQETNSPSPEKKVEEYRFNSKNNPLSSAAEPISNLPEERGLKVAEEQPFIEDYDYEDVPRKLKVSMATADIDEVTHPETWYGKDKPETNKGNFYPRENIYDEKSFIKKNIDNYQAFASEIPEDPNFFAKNVFQDISVKEGSEKEVLLERLKQRYENAYRENFLLDRAATKQLENAKSRKLNLPNVPFISEEQLKESKLMATLKSPALINDLKSLEQPIPITSESFQEFKNMATSDIIRSPKTGAPKQASRSTYIRSKENSEYLERRNIPLFDQFEREIFEVTSSNAKNPHYGPSFGSKEVSSASTHKSMFFQRPKTRPEDIDQLENFILDLHRTLSTNNGTIPQKYQKKLQELVNLRPTLNKYFEGKKNPKEEESEENTSEFGNDRNSEFVLLKDRLANVSQELTNKTLDALKPTPDTKLRRLLWQCIMALQANFDESIPLVNQHLVVSNASLLVSTIKTKFDKITQYASQPGKVLLQLRSLPQRLRKDEIKKTLSDDFHAFFAEIEEELSFGKLEDEAEKLLLKYVYFLRRFIEVLDREDRLKIVYNNEQKIMTNQRMNQKYLELAEKRKAAGEERPSGSQSDRTQAYGIDFAKWQENLEAIEKENKMLLKYNEEKKRKEEKMLKLEERRRQKEEEAKLLEKKKIEALKEQKLKEEALKRAKEEKREKVVQKIEVLKAVKSDHKKKIKEIQEETIKKTIEESQFKNLQKQKEKEEFKERQKERVNKLMEKKQQKLNEKKTSEQAEKEEEAWRKAQELFEKQRKLLQERDKLNQQLKIMGK